MAGNRRDTARAVPTSADRALIRSVSQATFEIEGAVAFEQAVREAAKWMRNRNASIPDDSLLGRSFEVGGGGDQPAQAVNLEFEGGRVWAGSLDFNDVSVAGRTWVTELTVAERNGRTHFGARLVNVTRGEDVEFGRTLPGVVRQVIERVEATADGLHVHLAPTKVDSDDAVDDLIGVLDDPQRKLPVVVVSEGHGRAPIATPQLLAERLAGAAHVYFLTVPAAAEFERRFGRQMSVFGGGARLYRAGFDSTRSNPFDHKLWVWSPINLDRTDEVVATVLALSVNSRSSQFYPRFRDIRQAAARVVAASKALEGSADLEKMFEAENERLQNEIRDLRQEFDQWLTEVDSERSELERALAETKADAARYRAQADALRIALAAGVAPEKQPLTDYASFTEWANQTLSPNVWIAAKAIKAMEKDAQFDSPRILGDALIMLDELYVPMRIDPTDDKRAAYLKRLSDLGCLERPCFSDQNEIKSWPEYAVTYQGRKFWCDAHIKYGGGKDPRHHFRIYFAFDQDTQTLIVGHLPTHLDNNLTN